MPENNQLIEFTIQNFRGVAQFSATPNGKSMKLVGKNGSGKTSCIDALWWGLGGQIDGSVIRKGTDNAKVEIRFGDYLITRTHSKEKSPSLTVKPAEGGKALSSPTALLSGFIGAIERQTFSLKKPAEQAAILRKLAPGIDTSKLDKEYADKFKERTDINRDAKQLTAQAAGIAIPEAPESVPDDVDLVAVAAKKTEAEKLRGENIAIRRDAEMAERALKSAGDTRAAAEAALKKAEENLKAAKEAEEQAFGPALRLRKRLAELVDPDTSAIDAEIEAGKAANKERLALREKMRAKSAAQIRKEELTAQAKAKQQAADKLTKRLEEIEAEKAKQLATAKLPIEGLAINGDTVTLVQDAGPIEIDALNTGARMRLDVAIAAALGHRLVAVRDASLLDDTADLMAFAKKHGVQLITEIVAKGETLSAEIEDAQPVGV